MAWRVSRSRSLRRSAARGEFDAVLAQYHDQGLIPVKLAAFGHAVNVTLGLPFVRTSVDHGTGFDIVEKGVAEAACGCPRYPSRDGWAGVTAASP